MAFKNIRKNNWRGRGLLGVTIAAYGGGSRCIRVVLGANLLKALDWSPAQRVEAAIGIGPDRGFLRLEGTLSTGYKLSQTKSDLTGAIRLKALYQGESHPAENVDFQQTPNALVIKLPEWAIPKEG